MTAFWPALAGALAMTAILAPMLRRLGLYDVPNHRSSHSDPVPRGGGVGVLLAVLGGVLVAGAEDAATSTAVVVLGAALVLGSVGLLDDLRTLPSLVRLLAQFVVAVVAVAAVVVEVGHSSLVAPLFLGVSTVAVVAYVNAFNFMDGINAISSLNAAVCGGWLVWLGEVYQIGALPVLGAALAGASLGFLPFNASSRIFLGDVGSYGLGAMVATASVVAWGAGVPLLMVVPPLVVYLADTGWALLKRLRRRAPLLEAHRDHAYQRLVRAGWPHLAASSWSAALSVLVCVMAAVLRDAAPLVAVVGVCLAVVLYLTSPGLAAGARARRSGAPV